MGTAFVFVPLLAAFAVVAYVVTMFACHYYVTVVEIAAHGDDTARWPEESFSEWLWTPFYVGWLAMVWAAPGGLLAIFAYKFAGPWAAAGVGLTGLMLLMPLGQLSAFVSDHPWVPFDVRAVPLLFGRPLVTLGFAGVVLLLVPWVAAGGFLTYSPRAARFGGPIAGPILLAVCWFAYARAVGRLLFLLTYEPPSPRNPADDLKLPVSGPEGKPRKRKSKPKPPAPKPALEQPPPMDRPKRPWDDEDDSPYAVHAPEVQIENVVDERMTTPKAEEMRLLERHSIPPPRSSWGAEAWAYLFQSDPARSVVLLAVLLVLTSGMVRALIALNPVTN